MSSQVSPGQIWAPQPNEQSPSQPLLEKAQLAEDHHPAATSPTASREINGVCSTKITQLAIVWGFEPSLSDPQAWGSPSTLHFPQKKWKEARESGRHHHSLAGESQLGLSPLPPPPGSSEGANPSFCHFHIGSPMEEGLTSAHQERGLSRVPLQSKNQTNSELTTTSNSVGWTGGWIIPMGPPTARKHNPEDVPGRAGVSERGTEEGAMGLGPIG